MSGRRERSRTDHAPDLSFGDHATLDRSRGLGKVQVRAFTAPIMAITPLGDHASAPLYKRGRSDHGPLGDTVCQPFGVLDFGALLCILTEGDRSMTISEENSGDMNTAARDADDTPDVRAAAVIAAVRLGRHFLGHEHEAGRSA